MSIEERLSEILTCSVCLEILKDPKTLPCQHTFCVECLRSIAVGFSQRPCPQCRTNFIVPDDGVQALPSNSCLSSVVDLLTEMREPRELLGAECKLQFEDNKCTVCNVPCSNCERKQLEDLEKRLLRNVDQLLTKMDETSSKLKLFEEKCSEVKESVVSKMREQKSLIEDKQSELILLVDRIKEIGSKTGSQLLRNLETNTDRTLELLSINSDCNKSISEKVALFVEANQETSSILLDANVIRLETPTFSDETLSISHPVISTEIDDSRKNKELEDLVCSSSESSDLFD